MNICIKKGHDLKLAGNPAKTMETIKVGSLIKLYPSDFPGVKPKMLVKIGNPFYSIGVDSTGRESINLGVYGIPETFILDSEGQIRYRHIGPILEFDLRETILTILTKLEKER